MITFNGIRLNEYIKVTNIKRDIGNNRIVKTSGAPSVGANIQTVKNDVKLITVEFVIISADLNRNKHTLAGILNSDEPKRLTFEDEPNVYYNAIVVNSSSVDDVVRWFGRGKIEFLIPDGVAHSVVETTEQAQNVNGVLTLEVNNKGSVPVFPVYTIRHAGDNGYIGLVNSNGVLELGNPNEVDTQGYRQSEHLIDYSNDIGRIIQNPNQAIVNERLTFNGSVSVVNWDNVKYVGLSGRTASVTVPIPRDSEGRSFSLNDYIYWRQVFWAGAVNQCGYIKISVSDEDNQYLYSVETIKRRNGLEAEYNVLATDGRDGYQHVKSFKFIASDKTSENPFLQKTGFSDIQRHDDELRIYWFGSYHSVIVPALKGKKSAKIHVTFSGIGNADLITRMYLREFKYTKNKVDKIRDVPNRYSNGSVVVVDCEKNRVTVNGIDKNDDVIVGSTFHSLPVGNSTVKVYFSSWVRNTPQVEVRYRGAWL